MMPSPSLLTRGGASHLIPSARDVALDDGTTVVGYIVGRCTMCTRRVVRLLLSSYVRTFIACEQGLETGKKTPDGPRRVRPPPGGLLSCEEGGGG